MRSIIRTALTVAVLSSPLATFAADTAAAHDCAHCTGCSHAQVNAAPAPAPGWRDQGTIDGKPAL